MGSEIDAQLGVRDGHGDRIALSELPTPEPLLFPPDLQSRVIPADDVTLATEGGKRFRAEWFFSEILPDRC